MVSVVVQFGGRGGDAVTYYQLEAACQLSRLAKRHIPYRHR